MRRRAKFALAAEEWLGKHAPSSSVSTSDLWLGLSKTHPELTSPSETRKTPKATCMRDLRKDGSFVVGGGKVSLVKKSEE
jgi:hypothetical protein